MNIARREVIQLVGAAAVSALPRPSWGQTWPAHPIRAIVALAAGTTVDTIARLVFDDLSSRLNQPITVENRPGASGTIAGAVAARAAADGGTILVDSTTHTIVPSLFSSLPYDPVRDFLPVVPLAAAPIVLVAAPSKGFRTLDDLVAAGRAQPRVLSFASAGVGSINHLAAERLCLSAGFKAVHVPGRGLFVPDLIAGRIDFALAPIAIDLIESGQLVALAVASRTRSSLLPHVPTTLEAGYADSDFNFYFGIFIPAKTPRSIVDQLNLQTIKAVETQSIRQKLAKIGAELMIMSPAEFEAMITKEFAVNGALARAIGLKAS
jgi:tripartite-type tricarboxylate transporter receptor subunit TctC